ncbi:MAG: response regulator [Syntrophobacteraceae bacterium]
MPDSEFPLIRTLLIEDDEDDFVLIRSVLTEVASARYVTTWVRTYAEAVRELNNGKYDICLLDYRLGTRNGLEILQKVSDCPDKPPIIILTGEGDYNVDIEAMKWGAADYLLKDQINEGTLERTIRYAIERRKAEFALRQSEKQLNYLSSQLLLVQENERRKVASELHDNLGQVLSAVKYNIESVLSRMPAGDTLTSELGQVIPLIQGAVEHVRNIYTQLRPTLLDDLGVEATLNWYCREFESANNDIRVDKEFGVAEEKIPESLKLVIFRIVQDAMENIAAHSSANNVWLSLIRENRAFRLDIRDDGKGFDVAGIMSMTSPEGGLGLRSMKRRAELSGGVMEIFSKAGMGTTVHVLWPEDIFDS